MFICRRCPYSAVCPQELGRRCTPIRACTNKMVDRFFRHHASPCLLMEVGYGINKHVRGMAGKLGYTWNGVEPRWDRSTLRGNEYHGSASSIPFGDDTFPLVVANNCMEHWTEFGDPVEKGLNEIYRVTASGGVFFAVVPMESHGSRIFKTGNLRALKKLYMQSPWQYIRFRRWKQEMRPELGYLLEIQAGK